MRLKDRVALVTGAGRGIGRGIALKLSQEGAKVVVASRQAANAEAVAAEIVKAGGTALAIAVDVGKKADVEAMFAQAEKTFGPVDILVNNAGITQDGAVHKMSDEAWDAVLAVNLNGTFYCLRRAAQTMRERGYGRIVNISSVSWLGNPGQANYAASKAGVIGLTGTAARELAKKGVTVNAICPGLIDTDMAHGIPPQMWDGVIAKIWTGRVGKPEEVANVVAFLASEEASYITGEVINVSGGISV